MKKTGMDKYFSGDQLYGDNFDADQIKSWFQDEENALCATLRWQPGLRI
jgi:hypothetical protein